MRKFTTIFALLTLLSSQCFADSHVIGSLEVSCPIQGQVVSSKTRFDDKVFIVEKFKVHELSLYKNYSGGMSYYKSKKSTSLPPTFEARIMSPTMSRLSEVTVYLSGVSVDCLIEVR